MRKLRWAMVSSLDLPQDASLLTGRQKAHAGQELAPGLRRSPAPPGYCPGGPLGFQEGEDPTMPPGRSSQAPRYPSIGVQMAASSLSRRPPHGRKLRSCASRNPFPHWWLPSAPWGKSQQAWPRFSALAVTGVLSELILLPRRSPRVAPRGSLLGSARGQDLTPALTPHCQPPPSASANCIRITLCVREGRPHCHGDPGGQCPRGQEGDLAPNQIPPSQRPELQAPPRASASAPTGSPRQRESEVVWFG